MLNLYGLSNIMILVTSVSMAFFVALKGFKNPSSRKWAIFSVTVAIYGFGAYMVSNAHSASEAIVWWQVAYVGIIFIPLLFLYFNFKFLNIHRPIVLWVCSICTFIFLYANVFSRKLFVADVKLYFTDNSYLQPIYFVYPPGKLLLIFIIFSFVGWVTFAHYELIKKYRTTVGIDRNQLRYFFVATALGFAGGGMSFLPCFGISFYPYFNFTVALYPLIMVYAMFRYRLMDVTVVMTRTGIFIVVYTLVLGLPFALSIFARGYLINRFGAQWWMVPLILMACLSTIGPFIYIYLERSAEERLLKEQRRYQRTLKQASIGMTRIRDLHKLLELITHIVTKTVRISFAAVYLFNEEENLFRLQVARDRGRKFLPSMPVGNPLIQWLLNNRQILIYEEMKRQREDTSDPFIRQIEENMRLIGAAVIIPSFLEDRFIGFIALGEKLSGQIYTPEDLNVFQILATQAALAIENAQFYEEAKQMQEQVAQAEKMATIGTMADGLSHQINNRFYALSLIASDSIDTIKMTDTSQCTPEVKEMLTSVGRALERIQANVMQGGEVVKGILKYTRKGQEGFEPLALDQIVTGTLDMVQYKIKLNDVDVVRSYPGDAPLIKGNLVQLQEAFFNLIDNAYDAIVERQQNLKEPGYKGRIEISMHPSDSGMVKVVIQDNGMGIKDTHSQKLFTPFFTTKISARKGTGLGLYVIKRIISEMHGGLISFESKYGAGTRFMLTLPTA